MLILHFAVASNYNVDSKEWSKYLAIVMGDHSYYLQNTNADIDRLTAIMQEIEQNITSSTGYQVSHSNMTDFIQASTSTYSDLLLDCAYYGTPYVSNCLNNTYWTEVYTSVGKCFTFNYGNSSLNLKQIKTGSSYGLHLTININHNMYTGNI